MKGKRFKQIAAWIAIGLLVLMYVILLVLSLLNVEGWYNYFMACLGATVIVPIILWINIFLYDRIIGKRSDEDEDRSGGESKDEDRLD